MRSGERLLDIGSGWGWLIIRAVELYGVKALGITLSEEQYQAAREKSTAWGWRTGWMWLANYLDLDKNELQFNKIVSIGMFEHVGKANLRKYMEKVDRLLAPADFHSCMIMACWKRGELWMENIFSGRLYTSLRETVWLLPEYDFHLLHAESAPALCLNAGSVV